MVLVRGYGLSELQTELPFLPCFAFLLYGVIHDVMSG